MTTIALAWGRKTVRKWFFTPLSDWPQPSEIKKSVPGTWPPEEASSLRKGPRPAWGWVM